MGFLPSMFGGRVQSSWIAVTLKPSQNETAAASTFCHSEFHSSSPCQCAQKHQTPKDSTIHPVTGPMVFLIILLVFWQYASCKHTQQALRASSCVLTGKWAVSSANRCKSLHINQGLPHADPPIPAKSANTPPPQWCGCLRVLGQRLKANIDFLNMEAKWVE